MVNAGRILIITKGTWDSLVSYEQLDLVTYNQIAYIARQASVGVNPANDTSMTYWQPFGSAASIATTAAPGLVMPDGDTIKIDATGLIWVELDADAVDYDGSSSRLSATDVQNAIDQAVALAKVAMTGIAPIEATSTASQAYSQGDLFFYNGKLYVATASIAQGATITPNTNCSETSIETLIAGKADKSSTYQTTDTAEQTVDGADYIPFYDSSASAPKKILVSDLHLGDTVTVDHTGTASDTGVRYQRIGVNGVYSEIDGTKYMEQTLTLSTSADTVFTFTNADITANSDISVQVSKYGVVASDMVISAGSCVLTFPKYDSAISLTVRIYIR